MTCKSFCPPKLHEYMYVMHYIHKANKKFALLLGVLLNFFMLIRQINNCITSYKNVYFLA